MKRRYNKKTKKHREKRGLYVEVYNNNVELALKKFKRKVKDSKLMVELKDREYFKSKSRLRREKLAKAKARLRYN